MTKCDRELHDAQQQSRRQPSAMMQLRALENGESSNLEEAKPAQEEEEEEEEDEERSAQVEVEISHHTALMPMKGRPTKPEFIEFPPPPVEAPDRCTKALLLGLWRKTRAAMQGISRQARGSKLSTLGVGIVLLHLAWIVGMAFLTIAAGLALFWCCESCRPRSPRPAPESPAPVKLRPLWTRGAGQTPRPSQSGPPPKLDTATGKTKTTSASLLPLSQEANLSRPVLSPELIVPLNNECSLLIPRVPASKSGKSSEVTIDDANGMPVFRVSFDLSSRAPTTASESLHGKAKRIILSSALHDIVFGFCCDSMAEPGSQTAPGLSVYHASGLCFGTLSCTGLGSYMITSRGFTYRFHGDPPTNTVHATDDVGRLLAVTEAANSMLRSVRIGPEVDAGLIVIALLSMDFLQETCQGTGSDGTDSRSPRFSVS